MEKAAGHRTQKEWLMREREKLKDRVAMTEDKALRSYYYHELSNICQRILTLES